MMAGAMAVLAGCGSGGDGSTPDSGSNVNISGTDSGTPATVDEGTPTRACIPITPEVNLSFLQGSGHKTTDQTLVLPAGEKTTVTLLIENTSRVDIDVEATLDAPWPKSQVTLPEDFREDEPSVYAIAEWELTVPDSAGDDHTVTASVTATYQCEVGRKEHTATLDQSITTAPAMTAPYGFNAGGWYENDGGEWVRIDRLWFDNGTEGNDGNPYVSVSGDASASPTNTTVGQVYSDAEIVSTDHDFLYQTAHVGGNLGYDIAIENGTYDVTLYFAENNEEISPGKRLFDVVIQGVVRLEEFDVIDQNEFSHAPVIRTFNGIEVNDETLSITTESINKDSLINGFAIRNNDSDHTE